MTPHRFRADLLDWYDLHKRDLPWRVLSGFPDPYHVLLSETMLQQTQVATVIDYFHRFLAELPTLKDLAAAEEQTVLRLWQGLGYYRRARNLHAAAKAIVAEHDGRVPSDVETLLTLPGVGRYTAGAIASLAFGTRAPILDGNVQRVLCRLEAITDDPRQTPVQKRLWQRAEELLPPEPGVRVADVNSALMELGATVCQPKNPQCLICPVRPHCQAQAAGIQATIPPPKQAKATPLIDRDLWCRHHAGRYEVEQRGPDGRWPNLWQFPVRDPVEDPGDAEPLGEIAHGLTHRRYRFRLLHVEGDGTGDYRTLDEIDALPKPKPHVKVLSMLRSRDEPATPA